MHKGREEAAVGLPRLLDRGITLDDGALISRPRVDEARLAASLAASRAS
jgi:hypothetical protein